MNCKKCNEILSEGAAFCESCGKKVEINSEFHKGSSEANEDEKKAVEFIKRKGISYLDYAIIQTTVELQANVLKMTQKRTTMAFFKKVKFDVEIPLKNVQDVISKNSFEINDLIFAVVSGIAGLFNPWYFILCALFLWSGFGSNIYVYTHSDHYVIPSDSREEAVKFIARLKKENPDIIVNV